MKAKSCWAQNGMLLGAEELKDFHGFYLIRGFIEFTIEFTIASLYYVRL